MMLSAREFFDLEGLTDTALFAADEAVWKALDRLPEYLDSLFQGPSPLAGFAGLVQEPLAVHEGQVVRNVRVEPTGPKGAFRAIARGAELEGAAIILPGAFIVDERVLIGPGSVVEPGAFIRGPAVIGRNTEIRQGAYMRGNCLVGDDCVVGHTTEMKGSILLNGAKAGHFAYVGDSILGKNVNLGAGTKLANLRVIPGNISLRVNRQRHDTGRRKLGAILGDRSETGCNSVTSPGTLMGPQSIVYPGVAVHGGFYPAKTQVLPAPGSLRIHQPGD